MIYFWMRIDNIHVHISKNDNDTLEDAQQNKMNHIIKKLNLKNNQKVLDIGSDGELLAIEIAKQSQCEVTGITLSENQ